MTSVKCFSRWIKEAGRGHMCAFVSWGLLMIYGVTMVTRLSFDTEFIYFGMGSTELAWICEGLGLFLSFFEFFYLFFIESAFRANAYCNRFRIFF